MALLIIRAVLRDEPRWWLAAGVVVGLSMYNKLLIAMFLAALAAGIALVGRRRLLVSPWVIGSAGLALAIGSPNLFYQATHHWPSSTMGQALADNNSGDVHVLMWPFLLILLGPPLAAVWIAGLVDSGGGRPAAVRRRRLPRASGPGFRGRHPVLLSLRLRRPVGRRMHPDRRAGRRSRPWRAFLWSG